MGRFVSAAVIRELAKQGTHIVLEQDSVLTPSAKDLVKELGVTITRGNQVLAASGDKVITVDQRITFQTLMPSASSPTYNPINQNQVFSEVPNPTEVQDSELKKKVQSILEEALKPACPNPKAMHIRGDKVIIQPFDQAPTGQRIGLTDVITSKEGNLCAGFMTFDHSELPWFLNYDEADYIIEGDFMLKVGDQIFRAKAGDVVYIPKGSQVVFSSPTYCKVFYVTYPANWADYCE